MDGSENFLWFALGAAFIKLLDILNEMRTSRLSKRSLEVALKTEIVFLANIIAKRGLANVLDRALENLEAGRITSYDRPVLNIVNTWRENEPIYTANIDKIGLLNKIDASRIVEFHEILNLVKKDQLTLANYTPEAQKIALRLHAKWLRSACDLGELIGQEANIKVSLDVVRRQ